MRFSRLLSRSYSSITRGSCVTYSKLYESNETLNIRTLSGLPPRAATANFDRVFYMPRAARRWISLVPCLFSFDILFANTLSIHLTISLAASLD